MTTEKLARLRELRAQLAEAREGVAYYDGMTVGVVAGLLAGWGMAIVVMLLFIWGSANL